MDQPQQNNIQITPLWSQQDHDLLIAVKTTLDNISNDIKNFSLANTSLELRVRNLENIQNQANGGWKTITLIIAAIGGLAGLVIGCLNYFH